MKVGLVIVVSCLSAPGVLTPACVSGCLFVSWLFIILLKGNLALARSMTIAHCKHPLISSSDLANFHVAYRLQTHCFNAALPTLLILLPPFCHSFPVCRLLKVQHLHPLPPPLHPVLASRPPRHLPLVPLSVRRKNLPHQLLLLLLPQPVLPLPKPVLQQLQQQLLQLLLLLLLRRPLTPQHQRVMGTSCVAVTSGLSTPSCPSS
jgi:hypothetical protein